MVSGAGRAAASGRRRRPATTSGIRTSRTAAARDHRRLRVARAVLVRRAMLARMWSSTLRGIEATPIEVEVDVVGGLPSYHVVGLPTPSVREGAVRIRAALEAIGQALPQKKITVNLAPADQALGDQQSIAALMARMHDLPAKQRTALVLRYGHDLPVPEIAQMLGVEQATAKTHLVRGTLAAAILARELGLRGVVVPAASASEAAVVEGIEVYAAEHLQQVVAMVTGGPALARAQAKLVGTSDSARSWPRNARNSAFPFL